MDEDPLLLAPGKHFDAVGGEAEEGSGGKSRVKRLHPHAAGKKRKAAPGQRQCYQHGRNALEEWADPKAQLASTRAVVAPPCTADGVARALMKVSNRL